MLFSKKIKTILFLSLSAATAVPFLLCTTSCSSIDSVNIKILNSNSSGQKYNQLQNAPSISKLLYGDKNFYGGNYVLIIGCDGGQTTDYSDYGHLLFNNTSTFDYNNQIVGSQVITDSFEKLLNDDFTKNIGIATYGIPAVEIESYTSTDRHETVYANPWCVWSTFDENNDSNKKAGQYMRNDPTATQYRDIINTIKTLFGDAAATNVTNTSNLFAIEWNKGIPNKDTISAASSFGTSTAADTNFYNWVKQYHKIIK